MRRSTTLAALATATTLGAAAAVGLATGWGTATGAATPSAASGPSARDASASSPSAGTASAGAAPGRRPRASAAAASLIATGARCTVSTTTNPLGVPGDNCGRAGYQATGADFGDAQALITVPAHHGSTSTDPQIYVALDDSAGQPSYSFARVGVSPCTKGTATALAPSCPAGDTSGWAAYVQAVRDGVPVTSKPVSLAPVAAGDKIGVRVRVDPTGNFVHARIRLPDGLSHSYSVSFPHATFAAAQAQADWTIDHVNGTTPAPAPAAGPVRARVSSFAKGEFSTVAGQIGTFRGPWGLFPVEATTSGTTSGTVFAQAGALSDGGAGGGPADAFDVWRFPG